MSAILTESPSLADLLEQLGGISPSRIRVRPPLGTATEQDVIEIHDRENRLFELVDGVLVEKAMGSYESRVALILGYFLEMFLGQNNLGFALGADSLLRISTDVVRMPDVAFFRWERVPNRRVPRQAVIEIVPNLAVEVLSASNTRREMDRKLREYFGAGVELVWYIDPPTRTARIWTSLDDSTEIDETGTLDGGTVLPGFRLTMRDLFARAEGGPQP